MSLPQFFPFFFRFSEILEPQGCSAYAASFSTPAGGVFLVDAVEARRISLVGKIFPFLRNFDPLPDSGVTFSFPFSAMQPAEKGSSGEEDVGDYY